MDKSKLKTSNGVPLTQGLFLEIGYNEHAIFTLKGDDYLYNNKSYPSLKKLYLDMSDPNEYEFATTYLLGWDHWQRICNNKVLSKHINNWRYELELKLRSEAVKLIRSKAKSESGINAAKWLAEKGWDKKEVGRPSKEEIARELKIHTDISNEFGADVLRLAEGI